MRLLLFSNSRNEGEEYLNYTLPFIKSFLDKSSNHGIFIPFAGISIGFDNYFQKVNEKLSTIGLQLKSLHHTVNKIDSIEKAELIIVGGGNTFCLLESLQSNQLLEKIREKVMRGTPYIGWSAGANLACPTIRTTNDMPIVEPMDFNALNLIPFQINPHFTDFNPPGHAGETREMRIEEFLLMNQHVYVAGLREGTLFRIESRKVELMGNRSCRIFKYGSIPDEKFSGDNFDFLMH
jgi:dipeptidase E